MLKHFTFIFAVFLYFTGVGNAGDKVGIVLDWSVNTNHTGLYVAKDLGYFEAEGLDADILPSPEIGSAMLVGSGNADFGFSYQEEVTLARSRKVPILAVAAVINGNTSVFASPVKKGIKTPKDFQGRVYGGWGSDIELQMLDGLMKAFDADPAKVINRNIGSMDFFSATEGEIDFAWIFKGWTGIEAELRGVELNYIEIAEILPALNYYTPVIVSSESFLRDNPEKAKRFMSALAKGYEYAIANPQKAGEILSRSQPSLNRKLVMKSQEYISTKYKSSEKKWGYMKKKVWDDYRDWLFENKLLENRTDMSEAFTNEFLP